MLVFFSFADGNVSTLNGIAGYTVNNIIEAFTSFMVGKLMLKSFGIAVLVTLLCILIGYPAAWAIAKIVPEKYRSALVMISIIPAFTSQLLLIYSFMTLMQANGLLMTPLVKLGIVPAGTSIIHVVLPQSFSGLMTGILIVMIPAAGSFVEPNIAGGPYSMMIGNLIDSQFTTSMNMGYGAALSLVFLIVMAVTLAVIQTVMSAAERRIGG